MYHRFNEFKYPSTNISLDVFKKQVEIIKNNNLNFIDPKNFRDNFKNIKTQKKILLTIDDAYLSFYEHAWPYLKKNKIPFLLFVSTEPVGKSGYMTWSQIKEIDKESFAYIGNHSHSHDYLINFTNQKFEEDIQKSIKLFKENLGYNPIFFSYPFGEYSLKQRNYIKSKFDIAFGQHSGVIDLNKNKHELPRFPINEEYGDLKRFEFLIKLSPLEFLEDNLEDKLLLENNPPDLIISFFEDQTNLDKISCFSNDGEGWNKTKTELYGKNLVVKFKDKFKFRRGRINCSLNDNGKWRWLGLQFVIKDN